MPATFLARVALTLRGESDSGRFQNVWKSQFGGDELNPFIGRTPLTNAQRREGMLHEREIPFGYHEEVNTPFLRIVATMDHLPTCAWGT